jgi:hypothetical protein
MKSTFLAVLGPAILALMGFSTVPVKPSPALSGAVRNTMVLVADSGSPSAASGQYTEPVRKLRQPDDADALLTGPSGHDGPRPAMLLLMGTTFLAFARGLRRKVRGHNSPKSDSPFHPTQFQLGGGFSC